MKKIDKKEEELFDWKKIHTRKALEKIQIEQDLIIKNVDVILQWKIHQKEVMPLLNLSGNAKMVLAQVITILDDIDRK